MLLVCLGSYHEINATQRWTVGEVVYCRYGCQWLFNCYCSFVGSDASSSPSFDPMKALNWFVHAPIGQPCPLVLTGRLAAILTVPLLSLFIVSLAAENQRMFISCRLAGLSVDACILSIHGR